MVDRHWNYRIIDFGAHKALHEVHYENGEPVGWTESPATFVCGDDEDWTAITNGLAMAASDAARMPILLALDGKLISSAIVHRADITEMMIEKALHKAALKPSRAVALKVRREMMVEMGDDVIGAITESHIVFATACVYAATQQEQTS